MTHTTPVRVRYAETDAMGWVYYATYLAYFEVGRTELIRACWRSYRSVETEGMRLPVVEAGCRYHVGAQYDDLLEIVTRMSLSSAYRVRFDYHVLRKNDGVLLAEGFTEHCFVETGGKIIKVPDDLRTRVGG